jgi:hypothetical protein
MCTLDTSVTPGEHPEFVLGRGGGGGKGPDPTGYKQFMFDFKNCYKKSCSKYNITLFATALIYKQTGYNYMFHDQSQCRIFLFLFEFH